MTDTSREALIAELQRKLDQARKLAVADDDWYSAMPADVRADFEADVTFYEGVIALLRDDWRATHRHRKGGLYRLRLRGFRENDMEPVAIYDDEKGRVFVRPSAEFDDGRFAPLSPPDATRQSDDGWRGMDSAPRDGRELLFAVPYFDPDGKVVGFVRQLAKWDDGTRNDNDAATWRDDYGDSIDDILARPWVMWMEVALPAPPEA